MPPTLIGAGRLVGAPAASLPARRKLRPKPVLVVATILSASPAGVVPRLRKRLRPKLAGRAVAVRPQHRARVSRLVESAVELFNGNRPAADRWLRSPQRAFGGQVPLHLAATESGARQVHMLIHQLEHGVVV